MKLMTWENDLSSYQEKSIAATFVCQLRDLEMQFQDASNLLKMLAYLDPESISLDMLQAGAAAISELPLPTSLPTLSVPYKKSPLLPIMRKGEPQAIPPDKTPIVSSNIKLLLDLTLSPISLQSAITQLQNRSLVKRRQNDGYSSLWMHDLIQFVIVEDTKKGGGGKELFECAVKIVCNAFQHVEDPTAPACWRQCEVHIPHIQSLTTRSEISDGARDLLMSTNRGVSEYLLSRGRYNEAQTWLERLLKQQRQLYGFEHLDVLTTMRSLVWVYKCQGRYVEAEKLCNRVLCSQDQLLGCDHLDVLNTMRYLGLVYYSQGRYEEAEKSFNQVLLRQEQQLGSDHVYVLKTMHNLASVYDSQGRYAEAEMLYSRVLRSREQQLGSEHVNVLNTMHHLALVYYYQGRYAEAEKSHNRVLHRREQQLGSDHVDVLNTTNNLALVYHSQGRYTEAEKLYNRVLRSREQQLGPNHVDVLDTMSRLAGVYYYQGSYVEAEKLYNCILPSQEQQLGCGHIGVLATKHGLADVYRHTCRYHQAEALINEVLRYQEDQWGSHNFRTFWTMHRLACVYRDQRRHEETEELFRRILLGGTEDRSGPDHAQTVANIQVWVSNCHIHNLHGEVEATLLEVLAFREKILGPHHPHTRETMQLLAVLYKNADRSEDLHAINQRLQESC